MKFSFSFLLCSVLIYVTILCLHVTAEETKIFNKNDGFIDDIFPCETQYLKDFPSLKASSPSCRRRMLELRSVLITTINAYLEKNWPNDVKCIQKDEKYENFIDSRLKIEIIGILEYFNPTEKYYKLLLEDAVDKTKVIQGKILTACGIKLKNE